MPKSKVKLLTVLECKFFMIKGKGKLQDILDKNNEL